MVDDFIEEFQVAPCHVELVLESTKISLMNNSKTE